MSMMRNHPKLRGQILTDYAYTYDTAYTKLLFRDDLDATTEATTSTALAMGVTTDVNIPNYTTTTVDFIFPFKFNYRTMLDGVARGSVKSYHRVKGNLSTTIGKQWYKFQASLITKTSGGAVTTLGTADETTPMVYQCTLSQDLNKTIAIPFFISLNKKVVTENDKLLLRIAFNVSKFDQGTGELAECNCLTAVNADDIFVELPLVMG